MKEISKHISGKEGVHSNTAINKGIKNVPNAKQLKSMKLLAEKVFEPLRKFIDKPICVNSFFRCEKLNTILRGSKTSQHCKGEAIDISGLGGITNKQLFDYIKDKLDFDQLIWEFGNKLNPNWIHVSYKASGNRKQILRAIKKDGKKNTSLIKKLHK